MSAKWNPPLRIWRGVSWVKIKKEHIKTMNINTPIYHKIQSVWKRDPENNYKSFIEGEWSLPEFEALKDIEWIWTEKIDGMNIRVIYDPETGVEFRGKSDAAQMPGDPVKHLQDTFTVATMATIFTGPATLYGEGYGAGIQKGGGYFNTVRKSFALFDAHIGGMWLERDNVQSIAEVLNIPLVPIVGAGTLTEAIELVRNGYCSFIAESENHPAEGLVVRPTVELLDRRGNRIITKIKHKDFLES